MGNDATWNYLHENKDYWREETDVWDWNSQSYLEARIDLFRRNPLPMVHILLDISRGISHHSNMEVIFKMKGSQNDFPQIYGSWQ